MDHKNRLSNNRLNLIIAVFALLVAGLACGGSPKAADEKQAGPEYVGAWTAKDGSFITIRPNGGADYKIGGASVSGGSALVSEKEQTLRIALLGMGSPMKIDKAPANGEMTIDGIVYKKDGGGSTGTSESKLEIPGSDKLQTLVKTTMLDFNDALQSEDFSDFHKKVAKVWRDTITPEAMLQAFKPMVDNKDSFDIKAAISSLDATFTPAPSVGKAGDIDAVLVKGSYPTKPYALNFDLKYAMDDGTLKLVGINLSTKSK